MPDLSIDPAEPTSSAPPFVAAPVPQSSASATSSTPAAPTEVAPSGDQEPSNDPAFMILHGVLDATYVYFCPARQTGEIDDDAVPMPPRGLAYGELWVRGASEFDFAAAVSLWLVASEQRLAEGTKCGELAMRAAEALAESNAEPGDGGPPSTEEPDAALLLDAATAAAEGHDAGLLSDASNWRDASQALQSGSMSDAADGGDAAPRDAGSRAVSLESFDVRAPGLARRPKLRLSPFASFAEDSFQRASVSLLAATGCIGPIAERDLSACGLTVAAPSSLAPVWGPLSRIVDFSALGLQFLNASSLADATLRSAPDDQNMGVYLTVASDVGRGEIAPSQARSGVQLDDIGSDLSRTYLTVEQGLASEVLFSESWQAVLARSGNPELASGRPFTIALLGAVPPSANSTLNPTRMLIIENDPRPD
ncbi:MAG TPA: hypothetical protein VHM70_17570 [Polyangiaceae bacterium]|nr:hypothetical protein [Polyangiaceae bacterium]